MFSASFRKLSSTRMRVVASLLVLAFLTVEAAAFTHELRHDLQQHDDPSCVLHLYAEHLAKTTTAHAAVIAAPLQHAIQTSPDVRIVALARLFNYHVRAPPLSSARSF
jgi:hypothetical protein